MTPLQGLAWDNQRQWHVLQTGFDLGQHFLATWWAWQQSPQRPDRLFFSIVTDQPLSSQQDLKAAAPGQVPQALHNALVDAWRGMMPGSHRLAFSGEQVQLSVHVGPLDKMLRELDVPADRMVLGDAFWSPSASEDAHTSSPLQKLQALSRLCRPGTRVSWGTAPGPAPALWTQCGFELDTPSSTAKRMAATFAPTWTPRSRLRHSPTPPLREALVIGAGLSGSAVAHSLAIRGWSVSVLDQGTGVGAGASGLPVGLAAPHVSPDDSVLSRITRAGVRATLQRAGQCLQSGSDWAPTGVLEHRVEGKRSLPMGDAWPPSAHEWSTPATAEQVHAAGLSPDSSALWHGLAGWIRPRSLVAAQLQTPGVQVMWGQAVHTIDKRGELWTVTDAQGQTLGQAPLLVVASAFDSLALLHKLPGFAVPLNPLRGQISFGLVDALNATQRQLLPPFPVNGHGSFIQGVPTPDGPAGWYIGATFERNCLQAPVRQEDHAANQQRLASLLPDLGAAMSDQFGPTQVRGWAGLRCTLPDRLPAVGPIDSQALPGLWLSCGMGARGISLAVLCGELVAASLENEPLPLPPSLARHLAALRFQKNGSAANGACPDAADIQFI